MLPYQNSNLNNEQFGEGNANNPHSVWTSHGISLRWYNFRKICWILLICYVNLQLKVDFSLFLNHVKIFGQIIRFIVRFIISHLTMGNKNLAKRQINSPAKTKRVNAQNTPEHFSIGGLVGLAIWLGWRAIWQIRISHR